MSLLGGYVMTAADWAKTRDPDGKTARVVDMMKTTNQVLEDMLLVEGNLPTGHRTTILSGDPTVTWQKLNYGVQPSKGTWTQVDDTCGRLSARATVDVELARLNGDSDAFMLASQYPFLGAMNKEMATGLFYHDTADDPEKFLGLDPRYPTLATTNVINAGGAGSDTTSMWLIGWGPDTVHGTFPKGMVAGLKHEYKGIEPVSDSQTPAGTYYAHVNTWEWRFGLVVRDHRYVVRIGNIETTGTTNIIDPDLLVDAYYALPSTDIMEGRLAFYCNKTVMAQLSKLAMDKSNGYFTVENIFGKPVVSFWGIPIRRTDAILNTETALA